MRVVHYYPTAPAPSGVTASLLGWAEATQAQGTQTLVLYASGAGSPTTEVENRAIAHWGRGRQTRVPVGLAEELRAHDILVLHEGWVNSNYFAAAVARSRRVPFILFPQGVYEPGIRRGLKGEGIRRLAERAVLKSALAVHLSFESEIPLARALYDGVSTLVAPTGAVIPEAQWAGGAGYVAWFGRYEPTHKGLDYLLYAIHCLPPRSRPQVLLRGYDFLGGKGRVISMVSDLGLAKWVEVGPRIDGAEKSAFLQGADLYVHPSRWESHSVALIEALALGVPTVVSDRIRAAQILRSYAAASVVHLDPKGMSTAIIASSNDRHLGASGRRFVETYLSWPRVAASFLHQLHQLNTLMTKRL